MSKKKRGKKRGKVKGEGFESLKINCKGKYKKKKNREWCFRKSVNDLSATCQYRPLPEHQRGIKM